MKTIQDHPLLCAFLSLRFQLGGQEEDPGPPSTSRFQLGGQDDEPGPPSTSRERISELGVGVAAARLAAVARPMTMLAKNIVDSLFSDDC